MRIKRETQPDRMARGGVGILTDNQYFDLVNGHTKYQQDVVGSGLDMFAGVAARGNVLHERVQCVGYRFQDGIPRCVDFRPGRKGHAVSLTNLTACGSLDWWR